MRARSSRKKNIFHILRVSLIALVFVGIGLLIPKVMNVVGSIVMMPLHSLNDWLETSSQTFPTFVRSREALEEEIKNLEQELVISQSSRLTLSRLSEENTSFRSLLGVQDRKRIAAAVVARPSDLPYDVLQIDQGWNAGIKEGSAVYIGSDQFIGIVTQVAENHAFVEMLTSPGFEATTFISGPDVVATIEGYGGGIARVRVPQGIALTVGDLVHVLSVHPGVFGRISYIETTPSQPEQYGYISPELPLRSIHYVAVDAEPIHTISSEDAYKRVDSILREQLIVDGIEAINATSTMATSSETTSLP
jgi:cell shape-determining protein MreC